VAASLTVIIPTIGRDSLGRAVGSVGAQTVPAVALVEHDPDLTGCGPTLNRALLKVLTPWVATLGDDDSLCPEFAAVVLAEPDADLAIVQMRYPDGLVLPMVTDPDELQFGSVGCSYAVRTEVVRDVGGWIDEPCTPSLAEDWELIRAVRDGGGRVRVVPRVLYRVKH
jgi:hypothetical protein